MKFCLATLLGLLFLYEADGAPVVRGIVPNSAVAGEKLTVTVTVEDISSFPEPSEITFGTGVRVGSIVKRSFQIRHDRRILFLQMEIEVDASAASGDRMLSVGGSSPGPASRFSVRRVPEVAFRSFKTINADLIPWRLLSENLDEDSYDELAAVNISPFADGAVDVIHPFENKTQRIYSFSEGHLVSTREAVLADKDGDGFLDLATLNWLQFDVAGGVLVRTRNNGDGTFEQVSDRPSRIGDLFITGGNFDGDRFADTALVGYIGEVVLINGTGKQSRVQTIPQNFLGEIQGMIAADVNKDGHDDLVLAVDNEVSGKKEFRILIANQNGSFQTVRIVSTPYAEEGPWAYAVSDLDNDGEVEFIFTTGGYRSLIVSTYSKGKLTYRPSINVECNAFAVGDVDGDEDSDVACVGSDIDQITLFRSTENSFLPRITFPTPRYPVSVAVGDWDADQKVDMAIGFGKMYFPHLPNERKGVTFYLQE